MVDDHDDGNNNDDSVWLGHFILIIIHPVNKNIKKPEGSLTQPIKTLWNLKFHHRCHKSPTLSFTEPFVFSTHVRISFR
jgi:hypothetical protein